MKKYFFIHILLTFVASSLHAQTNKIFAVTYVVTTKLVGNDYDGEYQLLYNDTASIFTNMTMPKEDKIIGDGSNILTAKAGDPDGFPIYKNIKTKEMQIKYVVLTSSNPCIIMEPLPNIKWKIMKDTREIGGIKRHWLPVLLEVGIIKLGLHRASLASKDLFTLLVYQD